MRLLKIYMFLFSSLIFFVGALSLAQLQNKVSILEQKVLSLQIATFTLQNDDKKLSEEQKEIIRKCEAMIDSYYRAWSSN